MMAVTHEMHIVSTTVKQSTSKYDQCFNHSLHYDKCTNLPLMHSRLFHHNALYPV